jgi:hypothetical protein
LCPKGAIRDIVDESTPFLTKVVMPARPDCSSLRKTFAVQQGDILAVLR